MLGITLYQFIVGLVILAALILVVVLAVVLTRNPRVEFEGGALSIPRSVAKDGIEKAVIEITIPKGYTYAQMAELGKMMKEKVNEKNYDSGFLDLFWATAHSLFILHVMRDAEIRVSGEYTASVKTIVDTFGAMPMAHSITIAQQITTGALPRFTLLPEDAIATIIESAKTTGTASYQSCGEGCCSGFKPFHVVPPAGDTNRIQFTPGDINDALLGIHKRETTRQQGSGFTSQRRQMLRGPKDIETFSHYYEWIPRIGSSYRARDPTGEELRPSPANMFLHQGGPYDTFKTYERPMSDRPIVLETM